MASSPEVRLAKSVLASAGCRAIGVAVALALGALRLSAQRDATARASASGFIGVMVDSIHGGALAGAAISVIGTERHSTSDSLGRFRIDSVPPGAYRLAFSHPLFDTLGLTPTTQQIAVAAGRYVVVALGTPSARTLRSQLCPSSDTVATPSFVMGRVRDADSRAPAAGAQVTLVFSTTTVTRIDGVRHVQRVRRATTAADGTYAICGLESDVHGTVQVERGGVTTAEVETALGGKVVALRSLSAGSGEIVAVPPVDSTRAAHVAGQNASTTVRMLRGRASVVGFVFDSSGLPLAGAVVAVTSTAATARTGMRGEFVLVDLPSGTQELAVRGVGFEPTTLSVELTVREPRSVTVRLRRTTPSLAPVVVTSKTDAALSRLGFFDRQKSSAGHFITPDEVKQAQPHVVTDLMFFVPGWQVQRNSSGQTILLPPRSAYAEGASACINVFIDRALMTSLAPGEFDSAIAARDLVAMEVYSAASVPVDFTVAGRVCATIAVWTRARVGAP